LPIQILFLILVLQTDGTQFEDIKGLGAFRQIWIWALDEKLFTE
jgi:hypothetical protein